jgi:hypothetical protein
MYVHILFIYLFPFVGSTKLVLSPLYTNSLMETVEIPTTIMVAAVLKKLQLPCPKCKSHTVPVGVVLVVFFTLQHSHGPSDQIQGAKRIRDTRC